MHATRTPLTFFVLILLAGCQAPHRIDDAKWMTRTELFFGLSKPGGEISEVQWQAFVDDTITPRFPDGLTILDGAGQWKDSSGQISHERSKILLILHERDPGTLEKLDEIRAIYKQRFNQESVIRESGDVRVSF